MFATQPREQSAREELRKLAKAQQRLLPKAAPPVPGYEVALTYRPTFFATGDYYDFFDRPDGRSAAFIGDGSGHGPSACMLMAMMRTILRTHPAIHRSPGDTLAAAGDVFGALIAPDTFMTGIYLLFEDDGRVSWASAGHHPPLWVSRGGELAPVDLDAADVPLGIVTDPGVDYPTVTWDLAPGDRLLLFTDGLYEAHSRDGERFGRGRVQNYLVESLGLPLREAVAGLVARAEEHMEGADFEDDFTVIGIERTGEDEGVRE